MLPFGSLRLMDYLAHNYTNLAAEDPRGRSVGLPSELLELLRISDCKM